VVAANISPVFSAGRSRRNIRGIKSRGGDATQPRAARADKWNMRGIKLGVQTRYMGDGTDKAHG
jgi:hypothetical protein